MSGNTARPPAGPVGFGANSGTYPNPSSGLGYAGVSLCDDFVGFIDKTNPRTNLGWTFLDIAGTNTVAGVAPGSAAEIGVLRLATDGSANSGIGGYLIDGAVDSKDALMIEGSHFFSKVRGHNGTTNVRLWSGWLDSAYGGALDVTVVSTASGVIIRNISAGSAANWHGVVKRGTSDETTVDLGISLSTSDFFIPGWRITRDDTGLNVQFFVSDWSRMNSQGIVIDDVGDPVPYADVPSASFYPVFGARVGASAAVRGLDIDFWQFAGAMNR